MKNIYISALILSAVVFAPSAALALDATSIFTHVATPKAALPCTILTSSFGKGSKDTGSNGQVTRLQKFLAAAGYFNGSITGYFGTVTEASVKAYQKKTISGGKAIPATGFLGSVTRGAIQAASCSGTAAATAQTTLSTSKTTTSSALPPCPEGYTCDVKK